MENTVNRKHSLIKNTHTNVFHKNKRNKLILI